ncbi:unnamed protein product, partial [Chrysoparadoxa australica]
MLLLPWAKEMTCSGPYGCTKKMCCEKPDETCASFDCGVEMRPFPWAKEITCSSGCNHLICCKPAADSKSEDDAER